LCRISLLAIVTLFQPNIPRAPRSAFIFSDQSSLHTLFFGTLSPVEFHQKRPTDSSQNMIFSKLFSFFIAFLQVKGDCLSGSCQTISLDVYQDAVQDSEFVGHVFHTDSVTLNPIQCYMKCIQDCRCLSLNYKENTDQKYCELNEGSHFTNKSSLKQSHGSSYYILRRKVMINPNLLFNFSAFVTFL